MFEWLSILTYEQAELLEFVEFYYFLASVSPVASLVAKSEEKRMFSQAKLDKIVK